MNVPENIIFGKDKFKMKFKCLKSQKFLFIAILTEPLHGLAIDLCIDFKPITI